MSAPGLAGLRVLQQGGRASRSGGNVLLVDETPGREALLKVYRRRGSRPRELSRRFAYRVLERKVGVTAEERCAIERENLVLWRARGFDVPALIDRELPGTLAPGSALWMEYCPGRLLRGFVRDAARPLAEREHALWRFGADLGARQAATLESGERGLVMKHASIKHVLLHEGRQVSFDLEGVYARRAPLLDALADELAANLRSILLAPARDTERDPLGAAFLRGYARADQLARIADFGLRRGGLHRATRRLADRYRRDFSECAALGWVEAQLR